MVIFFKDTLYTKNYIIADLHNILTYDCNWIKSEKSKKIINRLKCQQIIRLNELLKLGYNLLQE